MMSWLKRNYPVAIVVFAASSIATTLIARPVTFLVSELIPDDAFYYFEIARNITNGLGSTFDGINLTNGYHPLWMIMITPFWAIFSNGGAFDLSPIRAVLILSTLLYIATGGVLYFLIRRYIQSVWIRAGILAFWFLNPYVLYESLSGLETPLSLLLIALTVCIARHIADVAQTQGVVTKKTLFIGGIVGGFMMLARLDNVFYFVALLLWLVFAFRTKGIYFASTIGLVASFVVFPFLFWNVTTFGMFLTSASVTSTVVNHHLIEQDNGAGVSVLLRAVAYTIERGIEDVFAQTGAPFVVLVFLGFSIGWLWFMRWDGRIHWRLHPEFFLFGGFILHFIVSTAGRFSYRSWYFIPANFFIALGAAWLLGDIERRRGFSHFLLGTVATLTLGLFLISWDKNLQHRQIAQLNMLHATQWMNEHLPTGSTIGVFNAGVQGYFSVHRVVNLDGLVNNAASQAILNRRLWDYALTDVKVGYISDFPLYVTYRYRDFLGTNDPFQNLLLLQEISTVGEHSRGSGIGIYEVVRQ